MTLDTEPRPAPAATAASTPSVPYRFGQFFGQHRLLGVAVLAVTLLAGVTGGQALLKSDGKLSGARPGDRPALRQAVAKTCNYPVANLYFVEYQGPDQRLAYPDGTQRPGWTIFTGPAGEAFGPTFAIDDAGKISC